MKYLAKYSDKKRNPGKPCLEKMPEIEFLPSKGTENTLFGPVNNRYKKKTNDELVHAAAWLDEEKCIEALVDLRTFLSTSEEHALKYEEYSTGKSHCESLSTKLEDLLDWFDEKTFDVTTPAPVTTGATATAPKSAITFMEFKQNLNRLFEFEDHKEDMINE